MQCDICGKEFKNVKLHKRMKHPELAEQDWTPKNQSGNVDIHIKPLEGVPEGEAEPGADESIADSLGLVMPEPPMVIDLYEEIKQLEQKLENIKQVGKSLEDIARILHEDLVSVLGEEHGFTVNEWGSFDPAGYLKVARKIKG